MNAGNRCVILLCLAQCALDHFMGSCAGEQDEEIRVPNVTESPTHLWVNFGFAVIFLTETFIFPYHAIVSNNDDNAHEFYPFPVPTGQQL